MKNQRNKQLIKQYIETLQNNPLYYYINILAYMGARDLYGNDIPETYTGFAQAIAIHNIQNKFEILTDPKTWFPIFDGYLTSPFIEEYRNGYYICTVSQNNQNIGKFFPTKGLIQILDQKSYFCLTQ